MSRRRRDASRSQVSCDQLTYRHAFLRRMRGKRRLEFERVVSPSGKAVVQRFQHEFSDSAKIGRVGNVKPDLKISARIVCRKAEARERRTIRGKPTRARFGADLTEKPGA